jgi:hypothetical protein
LVPVAVGAAPVVVGALGNGVRGGVIIDHPTSNVNDIGVRRGYWSSTGPALAHRPMYIFRGSKWRRWKTVTVDILAGHS